MVNRELSELMDRVKKASDRELSRIYDAMGVRSPLDDPANRLLLPSLIRSKMVKQVETWIREGKLSAKKDA